MENIPKDYLLLVGTKDNLKFRFNDGGICCTTRTYSSSEFGNLIGHMNNCRKRVDLFENYDDTDRQLVKCGWDKAIQKVQDLIDGNVDSLNTVEFGWFSLNKTPPMKRVIEAILMDCNGFFEDNIDAFLDLVEEITTFYKRVTL